MKDFEARVKKLLIDAEDCDLIARLATNPQKRALFERLAIDLRSSARDIEVALAGFVFSPLYRSFRAFVLG